MSYDLQVRPQRAGDWSAADVASFLERVPLLASAGPHSWQMRLDGGTVVSIDLIEVPEIGTAVEVSTSHDLSDTAIKQLYDFCARVADELGGTVYDPQGDGTYSPDRLRNAIGGMWSRETVLTAGELAFGGLGFLVGGSWWLAGKPESGLWVGSGFALFAAWFIYRVARKRFERHG